MTVHPLGVVAMSVGLVWAVRLWTVHGMWRVPLRNGEGYFIGQSVPPGFYREAGADLLRRYRLSLFLPLVVDAPLAAWLALRGRLPLLMSEQWIALIATGVVYNVMLAHFSARASVLVGASEERPAHTLQVSMAPRRLRDHTDRRLELAFAATLAVALALAARGQALAAATSDAHMARELGRGIRLTVWVLYIEVGLILLKCVFVRWRMPLPARRTDDFRRWRMAWLGYNLRFLDGVRVMFGLVLLSGLTWLTVPVSRSKPGVAVSAAVWALLLVAYMRLQARERRRLAAVEAEIRPVELVKEFPRTPVPPGRLLAGGLLYLNPDNPGVLVRSPHGIALNVGHAATYVWVGYFVGLALLMAWLVR